MTFESQKSWEKIWKAIWNHRKNTPTPYGKPFSQGYLSEASIPYHSNYTYHRVIPREFTVQK